MRAGSPRGLGGDCVPFIVFGKNFRAPREALEGKSGRQTSSCDP